MHVKSISVQRAVAAAARAFVPDSVYDTPLAARVPAGGAVTLGRMFARGSSGPVFPAILTLRVRPAAPRRENTETDGPASHDHQAPPSVRKPNLI